MSKRVTAAGTVQRGLFYLKKGDVRGFILFFFFFALLLQFPILRFQAQKEQEASEKNPVGKGSAHRGGLFFFLIFFFFSVHWIFLRNYINSGASKSPFRRQKGGKL